MSDPQAPRDWRDTVFLPKTDFPMKAGLPQKEPGILARWQEAGLYERLRAARAGREKFILHDGPPYANGDMHIGHALNHILKDMVCRTRNLMGYDAPYVPGWDCHGLPIEWKVEEEYRKQKKNKDEVPPAEFRAQCRAYAQKWVDTQREQLKRLGILGDWDHPYLTMDFQAEATIVSELMKFAMSDQLYRGAKPVMWSPVEKTALAEAEVEYEDIVSTQIDVGFEIVEAPNAPELIGAHAVIWTTTPWTIPVNQAIAYGEEVDYRAVSISLDWDGDAANDDRPFPAADPRKAYIDRFISTESRNATFLVARDLVDDFTRRIASQFSRDAALLGLPNLRVNDVHLGATVKGSQLAGAKARHPMAKFFDRRPREGRGLASSSSGEEGSLGPDQVRADETLPHTSAAPLPLGGGVGGGGALGAPARQGSSRPNPASGRSGSQPDLNRAGHGSPDAPEGEGLNVDPTSPLAEFFLRPRPFLPGDFVTTDQGTGLVHMAPDHGEDDFELCKAHGLNPVFAVEGDGKYRADWPWLGGQGSVINPKFNAPDGPICTALRDSGALLAANADYKHSYPHSWRSKAKLIFRCTPQWFVPMDRSLDSDRPGDGRQAEVGARSAAGSLEPLPLGGGAGGGGAPGATAAQASPHPNPASGRSGPQPDLNRAGHGSPVAPKGEGLTEDTLRHRALAAIDATQFYPPKGRNRIRSMVEGRPDWVLSRQRAWGVPITLFVHRQSGRYLQDEAVNARIVAAIRESGVDAWTPERAQEFLGDAYRAEDYEQVFDILDVWFDSGSTHAFVLDSGRWPDLKWPADLYLEGSDQHRGWFQSSLLEACGTRGRAPYDAVLTHGFTMDAKGMKMSKSLGNTINPLDLMRDYGADILRLWALSVDFTEDHRIGKEILGGVADQYRKLRNTFRYLLGALEGFDEDERVAVGAMPELERYMLSLLAKLDGELRAAAETYEFNRYVRLLTDFANEDLSAFYFDIRKDALYCDIGPNRPEGTLKRRAYRTVLDTLFQALLRYAAPVIVFTAEEVWGTRYPEGQSVHLLEWPVPPEIAETGADWSQLRALRTDVLAAIEPMRRAKEIGSGLEAVVTLPTLPADADLLAELFISSSVGAGEALSVARTPHHKCGRCWRHLPEVPEDDGLCARCTEMVA